MTAVYAAVAGFFLLRAGENPEWFVQFGRQSTVLPYAKKVIGPDVLVPHNQGQDGQTFWLMAHDPLLLHPDRARAFEDRPVYRSQRVLYPAVVAPAVVLGERAVSWALLGVNLFAVGIGTYWAVALASAIGAPRRAALAYACNPAVAAAFLLDTADVLAIALVVAGMLAWTRRRVGLAAAAFAGAALSKEIMLIVPCALAVGAAVRRSPRIRDVAAIAFVPVVATATWATYVRVRLGWSPTRVEELAAPFTGLRDAWQRGWHPLGDWGNATAAVAVGLAMVAVLVLFWRRRSEILLVAVPFALLYPFLSAQVLDLADNSVRALGPALTFLALGAYAPTRRADAR